MAAKPQNSEAEKTVDAPQPDPALMRQQQLQQQYQQINGQIMDLRQKESLIKDMITDATIQAAEIRGALKEITPQKG
jgi:uncharacterized phage infection (PIP) family protein YhgE